MNMAQLPQRWQDKIQLEPIVDALGECWIWTGAFNGPYGKVNDRGRTKQAHRATYERLVGAIPDGLELDHLCHMQPCVRPDHTEPVTRLVNMQRSHAWRWEISESDRALDEWFAAVAATGITDDPDRAIAEFRRLAGLTRTSARRLSA